MLNTAKHGETLACHLSVVFNFIIVIIIILKKICIFDIRMEVKLRKKITQNN